MLKTLVDINPLAPFIYTVDTDSSFKESRGPTLLALSLRRACNSAFLVKAIAQLRSVRSKIFLAPTLSAK